MNIVHCPECGRKLKHPPELQGHTVRCPHCSATISAATLAPSIPSAPPAASTSTKDPTRRAARASFDEDEREMPMSRPTTMVDAEELIDMTAMVDIVFFLLIFFLVTSMAGIHSSAKMPRPETQGEETGSVAHGNEDPRNDPKAIIVTIKKDDTIEIDGVPFHDIGDLMVRLRQLRATGGAATSVLIIGHGDATHGTAVAVMDASYEVGIDQLRMAVQGGDAE